MNTRNQRFWTMVAFDLTVAARETYVLGTEMIAEPAKLRAFNEMLHRICSHLVAVQSGAEDDESGSWLLPVLTDMAARTGTAASLSWAVKDVEKKTLPTSDLDGDPSR